MSYSIKDMDTASCIGEKQDKSGMSHLAAIVLAVHLLFLWTSPVSAYVWRCHSPHGDFWTTTPKESDDCSEYDSLYNPDAAPPMAKQRTSMQFTTPEQGTKDKVQFRQQELDQMLAPIALYPDSLLSQILMASTYPLEIVEAARWVKAHPTIQGDQAVQATDQYHWEPSVKSLVAFPNVLAMMDEQLDWTERLGDAFLSQEPEVLDTVQNLRQRASANGTLQSTAQVRIDQEGQNISITSPDPQVVYVPYYDPAVIYGRWWWQAYPPVSWQPWPGYFVGPGLGTGYVWGPSITVGAGFFFGAFDWPHRQVNVVTVNNFYFHNTVTRTWTHDPLHRRGVLYRGAALRQQYGRAPPHRRSDRISADIIPPGFFPGVARVSEIRPTPAAALQAAVRRCPPPPGFAAANCDRTPSKASATEDLRTTSEHAAMAVLAVAGAVAAAEVITAVVEAITAGDMRLSVHFGRLPFAILTVLLLAMPSAASSEFFVQTTFSTAEEGMQAFVEAIQLNDPDVLQTLLGAEGLKLFDSGDAAVDAQWRKRFLNAYADANKVVLQETNTRAILTVGRDQWPMPIQLVKSEKGWRFDTHHAAEEILNRHIGRNELAAIQVSMLIHEHIHTCALLD